MNNIRTIGSETFIDPICAMTIKPETAAGSQEYKARPTTFARRVAKVSFKVIQNLSRIERRKEYAEGRGVHVFDAPAGFNDRAG